MIHSSRIFGSLIVCSPWSLAVTPLYFLPSVHRDHVPAGQCPIALAERAGRESPVLVGNAVGGRPSLGISSTPAPATGLPSKVTVPFTG